MGQASASQQETARWRSSPPLDALERRHRYCFKPPLRVPSLLQRDSAHLNISRQVISPLAPLSLLFPSMAVRALRMFIRGRSILGVVPQCVAAVP